MKNDELMKINLSLFDAENQTNRTTDAALSDEMKTYYSSYLIDLAEPKLVHDQFGQKHPIPKNKGKQIEFRKYDPLPKALVPLTEGVTPNGSKLRVSVLTSTLQQYGDFTELSDTLLLTAIDNNLIIATRLLASQAGRTLDTITREVLNGGTNVLYSSGKLSRAALVGGDDTAANNSYLKVDDIKRAVRALKVQNAEPFDEYYCAVIHPDCSYDLTNDPRWKDVKTYCDPEDMYKGEIGRIEGCRFIETTEAKIFHAEDLAEESRTLLVNYASGYSGAITSVTFDGATVAEDALIGRTIMINGVTAKITDNTATTLTFASTNFGSIADNTVIYPGEAGKDGRDVYSTLVFGSDAYGVTGLEGGGLQHIVKQLGSAGTADPLNQRATAGWKAYKTAERLVEQYMIRIESTSTFESGAN